MLRILAPTDFSTEGYNARLVAMQLAQRFGWEVLFVHAVVRPPVPAAAPGGLFQAQYEEAERQAQQRLREECQHLLDILDLRHREVHYKTVVVPAPFAEAMLQVIAQEKISLVIMGTRGSNTLKKIFLGSNTQELMRLTPAPLLVVPSYVVFEGFTSITFLVDPGRFSYRPGLKLLERLARSYKATLHFLVITQDGQLQWDISRLCQPQKKWERLLELPNTLSTVADTAILRGLEQHMEYTGTNLLVLQPNRKSIWEELFSESIVEQLASEASMPMLVLPDKV